MKDNTSTIETRESRLANGSASAEQDDRLSASEVLVDSFQLYARERPEMVTLWAFGIGFVLGWKLKPW